MKLNKNLLEAKMKEFYATGNSMAEYLGIDKTTFSLKLNSRTEFTAGEICKIKEKFDLSADELVRIFFTPNVSQKERKE